jgi:hypothetical protein
MLLVKTEVGPSSISGFGLLAAQFIPKGTPVWTLVRWFDLVLTKDQVEDTKSLQVKREHATTDKQESATPTKP